MSQTAPLGETLEQIAARISVKDVADPAAIVVVSEPQAGGGFQDAIYTVQAMQGQGGASYDDTAIRGEIETVATAVEGKADAAALDELATNTALSNGLDAKADADTAITYASINNGTLTLTRPAGNIDLALPSGTGGADTDVTDLASVAQPLSFQTTRRDGTTETVTLDAPAAPDASADLTGTDLTVGVGGQDATVDLSPLAYDDTALAGDVSAVSDAAIATTDDNGTNRLNVTIDGEGRLVFLREDGGTAETVAQLAGKAALDAVVVDLADALARISALESGIAPLAITLDPTAATAIEGTSDLVSTATATDGDGSYTYSIDDARLTIDSAGAITWDTAAPAYAGDASDVFSPTVTVTDGTGATATASLEITIAEAGAKPTAADLGFWQFGNDNVALEEFEGGRALTPNTNAAPDSSGAGFATLAAATSNGLLSDVIDRDQVTWWGMVRFPGTTAQVIVGAFNRDLSPRSFGTFSNGADVSVEGGPIGGRTTIVAAPQGGEWIFVAGSIDAAGNYVAYANDGTTPTSITGGGTRNTSTQPIAIGDGASRNFTNALEVAEFGIGSAITDAATFDTIAADAFARLAERVTP